MARATFYPDTRLELDSRYVNITGDTMTGTLNISTSDVTVDAPTNLQYSIVYGEGTGSDYVNDLQHQVNYRVYAYKTVGATTIYSSTYVTFSTVIESNAPQDPANWYKIHLSWDAVAGATGYKIILWDYWPDLETGYSDWAWTYTTTETSIVDALFPYDAGNVNWNDSESPILVTPTSLDQEAITTANGVSLGNTAITGTATVTKDCVPGTTESDVQLILRGSTNTNKQFWMGFDTTNNYAYLQPAEPGDDYRDIRINPYGGHISMVRAGWTAVAIGKVDQPDNSILHLAGDSQYGYNGFHNFRFQYGSDDEGLSPTWYMTRSRGTVDSPTAVVDGDQLSNFENTGYSPDGSWAAAARIQFTVDGTPSTGYVPGKMIFGTAPAGGGVVDRMTIRSNGYIGIGTSSPSSELDVSSASPEFRLTESSGLSSSRVEKSGTLQALTQYNNVLTYTGNYLTGTAVTVGGTGGNSLSRSTSPSITGNWSISVWLKRLGNPSGGNNTIFDLGNWGANNGFGIWTNSSNKLGWRINNDYNHYNSSADITLNTWVHFVVVYNGSTVTIYKDGSVAGTPDSKTGNPTAVTNYIRLGVRESGNEKYNGLIDELQVYDKALSSGEVSALYNSGSGYYGSAVANLKIGYHFDENTGNISYDYSGNSYTVTSASTMTWATGKVQYPEITTYETTVYSSKTTTTAGVSGVNTYGDVSSKTIFSGLDGITIGVGTANIDYAIIVDGETNDGVLTWMEDEDYFKFSDDLLLPDNEAVKLGTGVDASITYDATNLIIDPKLVGTGYLGILGDIVQNDADSDKHWWGAGKDMSIYYDGTSGYVKTSEVGASDLHITTGTAKTLVLDTPVYDDLRVTPAGFDRAGVADPSLVSYTPTGSSIATFLYEFQKDDIAYFTVQLPHNYKVGEDIKVHVHWTPGLRGNEENGATVGWKVDYAWTNVNGTFGAMQTANLSDACDGTDDKHQMTPEATIDGHTSAKGISSMLICNIKRTDTGDDDTWAGTSSGELPMILEIDFHYPIDTLGSRDWGTK